MCKILFFSFFAGTFVLAQSPKSEVLEFTGIVKSFKPGFGLAYERLVLDVSGREEQFVFFPHYGRLIMDRFKVGDPITIRANINPVTNERLKRMSETVQKSFRRDLILAIKLEDKWFELPETKTAYSPGKIHGRLNLGIFLDREVKNEYVENGYQIGLVFDDGLVAYNWFQQKNKINIGDVISFRGYRYPSDEGFVYPIPDVKDVYLFAPLARAEGTIKSLLFKQNYLCIGITVKTKTKETRMGFPSNYGEQIRQFAEKNSPLIFYFDGFTTGNELNPPDLQAIISGNDTLWIKEYAFYGDADIKHDHSQAVIKGKITKVNRSDKGRIISIIVGNDCYVEVDPTMENSSKIVCIRITNPVKEPVQDIDQLTREFKKSQELSAGLGMGLWICNQILKLHGGSLQLMGDDFTFTAIVSLPKN